MEQVFWSKHCFLLILQKNKTAQECSEDVVTTKSTRDTDSSKAGLVLRNPSPAIHVAAHQEDIPNEVLVSVTSGKYNPFLQKPSTCFLYEASLLFSTLIKTVYSLWSQHMQKDGNRYENCTSVKL